MCCHLRSRPRTRIEGKCGTEEGRYIPRVHPPPPHMYICREGCCCPSCRLVFISIIPNDCLAIECRILLTGKGKCILSFDYVLTLETCQVIMSQSAALKFTTPATICTVLRPLCSFPHAPRSIDGLDLQSQYCSGFHAIMVCFICPIVFKVAHHTRPNIKKHIIM